MIRAIVTDIEGTTSDIRFVHNVLFPYARERLAGFVTAQQHAEPVKTILDNLRRETDAPAAGERQRLNFNKLRRVKGSDRRQLLSPRGDLHPTALGATALPQARTAAIFG